MHIAPCERFISERIKPAARKYRKSYDDYRYRRNYQRQQQLRTAYKFTNMCCDFLVISLFKISSGIFKNLSHLVFMNICLNSKAAKTLCAMRLLFLIELSAAGDYTMSFFVSTVPLKQDSLCPSCFRRFLHLYNSCRASPARVPTGDPRCTVKNRYRR